MIGRNNRFYWLRLFFYFILIFIVAWGIGIFSYANHYLNLLTHPPCVPSIPAPPGFENIQIPFHETTLNGLWKSPENGSVILILGGHGSNETSMLPQAQFLSGAGYGILTISYRHCIGEPATFGWFEVDEFNAAFEEIKDRAPQAKIGVLGFSAGSISAIRGTAAQDEVMSLVASGNYASLSQEIHSKSFNTLSLGWQIEQAVYILYQIRFGISPEKITVFSDLERISPRPILLIHGEKEGYNNQAGAQKKAAGENAVLWIVPGSGHGEYYDHEPQQYPETVINFFDATLK